mmetsp:Transcript_27010/g.80849  ORF Transcript_27010/g.80849 Transcript_27010/m.80849 type:complete len:292 (-) Transcript_27010:28-903(-)
MVWRAFAARAALPLATAAPLLFASRAARSDAIVEAADGPAPPTKGKRKAEIPEYFEPKLPYPAWDTDWDGLRHTRAKRKDGPPAPTRHVLLIRHGQYDESSREDARRILTPLGRDQAVATGLRLSELINSGAPGSRIRIQSSGLARAIETAALIEPHLPDRTEALPPDGDLNEGRPAQVIPGRAYSNAAVRADGSRIEAAFKKIFKRAEPRADGGLHEYDVVVCHGNVIRYMALRALQLPPEAWLRLCTFNCSITYLVIRPSGSVSMRALGDVGHLDPPLVTFSMHHGIEW